MALWFLLTLMLLVMCQPSVNTTVQNAVPYIGADIHSQDWSSLNSNSDQFIAMPLMSVFWRLDPQHFFPKIKEAAKEVQPLSHLVLTFQQSMLQLAKWRTSDTQGWLDSIGGGVSEKCISDIEYSLAGLIERKPWALNSKYRVSFCFPLLWLFEAVRCSFCIFYIEDSCYSLVY